MKETKIIELDTNIDNIITKNNKINERINIFSNKQINIEYFLYTDGTVKHLETWIDKKPYERDNFLKGCNIPIKRFEFEVSDANILLIEKYYGNKKINNLYINENYIKSIDLYQLSITEREKIMIKKMENIIWK